MACAITRQIGRWLDDHSAGVIRGPLLVGDDLLELSDLPGSQHPHTECRDHIHQTCEDLSMQIYVPSALPQLECYRLRNWGRLSTYALPVAHLDLHVVGRTKTSQVIERADGSSFNPKISAPTGATVVQKVPLQVPTIKAKKMRTP